MSILCISCVWLCSMSLCFVRSLVMVLHCKLYITQSSFNSLSTKCYQPGIFFFFFIHIALFSYR